MTSSQAGKAWRLEELCLVLQAKEQDLVIPAHKVETGDEYEGATVIEPVKG